MISKIECMLSHQVSYTENVYEIRGFLGTMDSILSRLTLYEVDSLWGMYSADYCASFLSVDDENLERFWEWLQDYTID